jgi:hypothetical protein
VVLARRTWASTHRFTRSIEGFRALGIPWGTGNALIGMAGVTRVTGDAGQADRLLDEATSVLRHAGPWFLNLPCTFARSWRCGGGTPNEAIALVRESLIRSLELRDRFAFVYALVPLATAAGLKGDDAWAARIHRRDWKQSQCSLRTLGVRDAVTERTGATAVDQSVRDLREQVEREGRTRLGPDRWDRAYAAGRRTSLDSLLKDIDRVLGNA